MKITELLMEDRSDKNNVVQMFSDFFPIAMKVLKLDRLPKIKFEPVLDTGSQPSFGMYVNGENTLYVGLKNRHPNDILRTVAHELVHYKQDIEGLLDDRSGETGSHEENQAHAIAGVIMRNFNKKYSQYLQSRPITEASLFDPVPGKINVGDLVTFDGSREVWKVIAVNLQRTRAKIKSQHTGMIHTWDADKLSKISDPNINS